MLPEVQDDLTGLHLNDRYRIDSVIGQGSMGAVYRARDTVLKRNVAVKILSHHSLGTTARERLLNEAQYIANLNHPNIVTVYDVGEQNGLPYIVMELVEGQTLFENKPPDLVTALKIASSVCNALQHAHRQGIIHRDIKPENILIDRKGHVKLMDFGIALSASSRLTQEGTLLGTLLYISPEQALGKEIDQRADLYSLGVILYEMAARRLPFEADDPLAVITQHLHAPVVPPKRIVPEIPEILSALIVQLLAKNPDDRMESAEEVREELEGAVRQLVGDDSSEAAVSSSVDTRSDRLTLLDRIVRGRLIGREKELAELRGFWDRAARGEGHMVLLSGEPGVGKTRLARELSVYARMHGAQVMTGGFQSEMDVSYIGLRDALRDYLDAQEPESLKSLLKPYAPELVKLLPEVCQYVGEVEPNPVLENLTEERLRLFDHITRLLHNIADRNSVVLVLEDLHWADAPSLQFIHYLLRNNANVPLLVVGTYREVDLDPARPFYEKLLGLNRERLYTRIALRRLEKDSTCRLVNTLLDGEVDRELAEKIVFETDGNPFYVEEVVKSLVSRHAIEQVEDVWVPVQDMDIHVPQSLQIAIGKRVFNLPEDVQEMLHLAAVSGHIFNVDVLLEMTGWDEDRLLDNLDAAEDAQLIQETRGDALHDYAFEHALIAQVLYENISQRRRARYHEQTAKAVEIVFAHRLEDVAENLAHHYALSPSRSAAKAVKYGQVAASKAERVYAHEQAAQYYQAVLDAYEDLHDPAGEAEAWEKLGDTWEKLSNYPKALESYQKSVDALESAGMVETMAYCQVSRKVADKLGGEETRQMLENLLENPALSPTDPLRATILADLSWKSLNEGDPDEALRIGEQAMDLAAKSGDEKTIGYVWNILGRVHQVRQDTAEYENAMQQLTGILEDMEDYSGLFGTFYDSINYHFFKGDMEKADQLALSGLSFCERCNTPGWQGTILAAYLFLAGTRGRYQEALEFGERVTPLYRRVGVSACFLYVLIYLVMINSRIGEIEKAKEHAEKLLDLLLQFDGESTESDNFLIWQFITYAFMARWEKAWPLLQEGLNRNIYPSKMISTGRILLDFYAPEVAARSGHYEFAEKYARLHIEEAREIKLAPGIAWGLFDLGLALAGLENYDESLNAFQEAIACYREFDWPWEIGQTLLEMAQVLMARDQPGDREQAKTYLQEAYQAFDAISARPMREKTESMLASMPAV